MKIIKLEQNTPEWHEMRLWKITWTRLKDVMWSNNLKLVDTILAELLSNETKTIKPSIDMQRGTDEEPFAIQAYENLTWEKVEQIWFCLSDEFDWVGLSPDGLIKKDWIYKKWVEVKNPSSSKHIEYIRINKIPNEYKYQVLHYFIVNEDMEELDFISYDRRVLAKPLHIVNVTRKDLQDEIENAKDELIKFKKKLDKYHNLILF